MDEKKKGKQTQTVDQIRQRIQNLFLRTNQNKSMMIGSEIDFPFPFSSLYKWHNKGSFSTSV